MISWFPPYENRVGWGTLVVVTLGASSFPTKVKDGGQGVRPTLPTVPHTGMDTASTIP